MRLEDQTARLAGQAGWASWNATRRHVNDICIPWTHKLVPRAHDSCLARSLGPAPPF